MVRPGLVLACLAVMACASSAPVHRPGELYLETIRIEGNRAIASAALVDGLALHRRQLAGRAVDEYQLGVDATRIAGAYQKLGYLSVDVHSRVDRRGEAETVVFTIVEGPRAGTKVEIIGLPDDVPAAQARALVKLADGGPFDYDAYDDAKATLLRTVQDAGYAHVQLAATAIADRAHDVVIARFVFDAGVRCTFGAITIAGASGAMADAIRARLAVHQGERYSTTAIANTQRALYAMGRFSTARVDIDHDSDAAVIPVKVAVSEANEHELRAGGGLGLDPLNYSARGRVTYTQLGWPFPMSTVGIDFKPAYTLLRTSCHWYQPWTCQSDPRVRLIGTFTQQDFVRPNLRAEVEAGLDYLTIEAYTIEGIHSKIGLSSPLGTPRLVLRGSWLLGGYRFKDFSPGIDPDAAHSLGIDRFERLGAFMQALVIDLRDHPVEPRYGVYAEVHLAEGTRYAGGAFEYVQWTPELRGFVPLGPMVLAARARIGGISGDVPPTERYYAGGVSSDRGYPERQLSPIAVNAMTGDTVVIGGAALMEASTELRIPLGALKSGALKDLEFGGLIFVDGGDVRPAVSELDPSQLHWAAGIGVRVITPIGPAGLDFAYRLTADAPDEPRLSRFQWFLSIGEAY